MQRIVAETCEDAAAEEFLMLGPIQMVHCLPGPFMDSHVPLGFFLCFFGGMGQCCCSIFGRLSWVGIQSPITSESYLGRKQK